MPEPSQKDRERGYSIPKNIQQAHTILRGGKLDIHKLLDAEAKERARKKKQQR